MLPCTFSRFIYEKEQKMTDFKDRESAFENKFALDETLLFKAEARCCKLFGLWMAEQLGLDGDEAKAYASGVVAANLEEPGFEDVKRAVASDINAKGLGISPETLDEKLAEFFAIAQKQIKENG
jgi:hypothetical protein